MNSLDFIVGLMKDNYESLGFIPSITIQDRYLLNDQYIIQTDHRGRPIGYLLHGNANPGKVLSIAQAVIDFDFRDRDFGKTEIQTLIERARIANCKEIKLRCADDLDANRFWLSQGFELTNTLYVHNKRNRAINVYMMPLWARLIK